jgi:IclR family transcriptional regulator, acetate operon repressor
MSPTERDTSYSMIERVSEVLKAFHYGDFSLTVTEIAKRSGIPKSTTARIVTEMIHFGLLERENSKVQLGIRLFELGQIATRSTNLRQFTYQAMQQLMFATGQTAHLAVLEGNEVVYVQILRSKTAPALPSRVGGRMPAYATGVGKVLLAYAPEATLEELRSARFEKRGPNTVASFEELKLQLEEIREKRLGFEHEESGEKIACAAAPIIHNGKTIAAISVSVNIELADVAKMGPAVSAVARSLSRGTTWITS